MNTISSRVGAAWLLVARSCNGGSCNCTAGFTGDTCEQAPGSLGNFTLVGGVCLASSPIDPTVAPGFTPGPPGHPAGRKADSVADCGRWCDEFPTCTNFTYHTVAGVCNLFTKGDSVTTNASCISGGSNGHTWPLPCRGDSDCSGHGTCNGGACNCTDGFQDIACSTAPADSGSCNIVPGVCMVPASKGALFKNSTKCTEDCKQPSTLLLDTVEECCYECSVFEGCQNFSYSISNKTCVMMAAEGDKTWDPTGDCQSGGKVLAQPNPFPSLDKLMPGVCFDGDTVATTTAKSVVECEDDCAGLAACVQWTFRANQSMCDLEGSGATKSSDPGCISGTAPEGGMLPCRAAKPGVANFASCSEQGTCSNGTCSCNKGYSGANCEKTPLDMGNCTLHHGICYDTSTPMPGFGTLLNISTVGDCCFMCDTVATCMSFVYNSSNATCTMLSALPVRADNIVGDPACISGDATEHAILPCRDDEDCNSQGSCDSGKCTCSDGFNGPRCEFVDKLEGNCTITEASCVTGSALFTAPVTVSGPDDCCYECTKHNAKVESLGAGGTGACMSFLYNSTSKSCTMFSSPATPVAAPLDPRDPACIAGVAAPVTPSMCDAEYIQAGVKLSGSDSQIGEAIPKSSLGECCAECEKTPLCANYTLDNSDGGSCSLFKAGADPAPDGSCISGAANSDALPCRESKDKLDCSGQGTCNNGTCSCPTGFSGSTCEKIPASLGGCTLDAGTCLAGTGIFGTGPADTIGDCCYLCDKQSVATPPCTNFTYNASSKHCLLLNDASPTGNTLSEDCVSGTAPGGKAATCRDGNKEDCSDQGTCTGGKCVCAGGFTGDKCQYTPKDDCMLAAGQCVTSDQVGAAGADDVGDCCHECATFPTCTNFTFNASAGTTAGGICTLHSAATTVIVSPDCISGMTHAKPPSPSPSPTPPTPPAPPSPVRIIIQPPHTRFPACCLPGLAWPACVASLWLSQSLLGLCT